MSAVKDQGYCGSCWAFGATAAIESHVALNTGLLFDLSVQQVSADFHNFYYYYYGLLIYLYEI
jgi:C1A family cysteine protease